MAGGHVKKSPLIQGHGIGVMKNVTTRKNLVGWSQIPPENGVVAFYKQLLTWLENLLVRKKKRGGSTDLLGTFFFLSAQNRLDHCRPELLKRVDLVEIEATFHLSICHMTHMSRAAETRQHSELPNSFRNERKVFSFKDSIINSISFFVVDGSTSMLIWIWCQFSFF